MTAARLRWSQVAAWRASRHHLDARVPRRRMLDVVSRLCGLHAQVLSSAELGLWARVEGLRKTDLSDALWVDRSLVKMWGMRGTLHVFRSDEHPLWQAAISTYAHVPQRSWERYFGVTSTDIGRLLGSIAEILDGRQLTREELAVEVGRRHRPTAIRHALRESWGGVLKPASYQGVLCFAPSDGQRVRFTNPRSWLGLDGSRPAPDDALREVIRRFLAAYGPASRGEVSRWWGAISPGGVETLIRSFGDEVVPLDVEGTEAWVLADDVDAIRSIAHAKAVRLLPRFDQYVIGSTKHSASLMPGDFRDRVHRQAGWVSPVLIVDGRIEGVWSHTATPRRTSVTVQPFARQPGWVRKGAEAEAQRLAAFLGRELSFAWEA